MFGPVQRAARLKPTDDHRHPPIRPPARSRRRRPARPASRPPRPRRPRAPRPWPEPAYDDVPMTGAQSLVRSLEEVGCEVVFGIPGGTILPAYDPLLDSTRVRHVLVRHEQGAGHAATGTRRPPARSGSAWRPPVRARPTWSPRSPTPTWTRSRWSRSPGSSRRALIGTDAFQEADISGITMPITKHNMLVTDAGGDPAGDRGGLPPGQHRPTRPGAGGHPQGRAAGADHLQLAAGDAAARLPADHPAARQADPRGRQAHLRGAQARCSTSAAACSRPRRPRSCCAWPS